MAFANIPKLEQNGNVEVLQRIAGRKRDKDAPRAMDALGRIGGEEAALALLTLSSSEDIRVWQRAQEVLRRFSDPSAVPALTRALRSPDYARAVTALYALRSIGGPEALEAILASLGDERLSPEALLCLSGRSENAVAEALSRFLDDLLQRLEGAQEGSRAQIFALGLSRRTLAALGAMGTPIAMQALQAFLRTKENAPQRLRREGARAVLSLGLPGWQIFAGYVGERLRDEARIGLLLTEAADDAPFELLLQNMEGEAAEALAETLLGCLITLGEASRPRIIGLIGRLDLPAAREKLLEWFVREKAPAREAAYLLARDVALRPRLVLELVALVHDGDQAQRLRAGGLIQALHEDGAIADEGALLVKAVLGEEGEPTDYRYVGPE
ncbi:MAG: HEAT repeat domain-containing protein [Christensenellaceae bacterium]|jgi:HEAT repeat protein|nr:HEAT repeat domain-containing protein [Christensenellaceae bacterium]